MKEKEETIKIKGLKIEITVSYDDDEQLYYEVGCETKGATIGQIGLALIALKQIEKDLIEQSEDVEPTFYMES